MLNSLLLLDERLFVLLNARWHCGVLDVVMPFVTNLDNWRLPILLALLALVLFGGARGRWAALLAVLALALGDQVSSHWLKPLVGRTRPCHVVEPLRLLVSCSGSFSFPSSHATNIAASMTIFALFYRRLTGVFAFLAFLVGYSRVYVGVHYPFDVLAGWLLGIGIAFFLYHVWLCLYRKCWENWVPFHASNAGGRLP